MAKIDLSDSRTPRWPALKLDVPLQQLYACLGIYVVTLLVFWLEVTKVISLPESVFNPFAYAALANYLVLVWLCYKIQKVLYDSGLGRHGAWQVVVGALLLNPCAFGWWIPISVLLSARRMRRALRERWPDELGI
jgi:hypothetical protein